MGQRRGGPDTLLSSGQPVKDAMRWVCENAQNLSDDGSVRAVNGHVLKARVSGGGSEGKQAESIPRAPQSSGCGGGRTGGSGGGARPALGHCLGAQQGADHHAAGIEAPAIPAVGGEGLQSPIFRSPKLMSKIVWGGPWDGWEDPRVPGGLGKCPPACP